jgi:CubicO group peptidase (beta-lactamase class C family)
MAVGYNSSGDPVPEYRLVGVAAGGYYTTIHDLGLFLASYSEKNAQRRGKVLQTSSIAEIARSVSPVTLAGVEGAFYGLGHGVHRTNNGDVILYHSGGNPGVVAYYLIDIRSGNGLAIVSNSDKGAPAVKEILQIWSRQYGEGLPPLY